MLDNQFYPTPRSLARKMVDKVRGIPEYVLEPSAGKGDLIDAYSDYHYRQLSRVSAIESDPDLQATLRGKGVRLISSDFLSFYGPDKFDLILMNPPFINGDKHLLHAIELVYSGQIVCLLNAETIRNPYTRTRQELASKLEELGAEIEYHQGAFENAERKTSVEVALINIVIERDIEAELFVDCTDEAKEYDRKLEDQHEVATGRHIEELVAEYNQAASIAMETIVGYYRNYRKVGHYIGLNKEPSQHSYSGRTSNLTGIMCETVNETVRTIRKDFWQRTLDLKEVKSRMTNKRLQEFEHAIQYNTAMDFTEANIRAFLLSLIAGYNDTLTNAVLEVFDRFTVRHCYDGAVFTDNIHYFNGWKTNNAFRVGKKIIIPVYGGGYGSGPFTGYGGQWELHYGTADDLRDIDVVMNYFDGCPHFTSIGDALKQAFAQGKSRNIKSTYFTISVFKKGTMHLTFNDENILRRFNVAACIGKEWLPMDYGKRAYTDMDAAEQKVVDTFEIGGASTYADNLGRNVFEHTWTHPLLLQAA